MFTYNWAVLCLMLGSMAQTGYWGDLLHPTVPAWIAVPVFILPVLAVVLIQPPDLPHIVVRRVHAFAAAWYALLSLGADGASLLGFAPDGELFYRLLMHVGWLPLAAMLREQRRRKAPRPLPDRWAHSRHPAARANKSLAKRLRPRRPATTPGQSITS